MNETYKKQVGLLLDVLPEVAKEECFAMHGGTAINLFLRDMPRLSVDIDLTYTEIAERNETLLEINAALARIKERIAAMRPLSNAEHKESVCKLQLEEQGVLIKVEVNIIGRGLIDEPERLTLCQAAQEQFDAFCVMPLVPMGQLYGGKICAALDRQHPRDLFDIKLLLDNEGLSEKIMRGLTYALVSSNRPTHELLEPHLLDQRAAFENQFDGMTAMEFDYETYEATRVQLIDAISDHLNDDHRRFLLGINQLTPDWSIFDYQNFPAVQWKLLNLEKFKRSKPKAYQQQLLNLKRVLSL
jgi:predicted nucleotidyltransferase component of viral defense system